METGKTVAQNTYVHIDALEALDPSWREAAAHAATLAKAETGRDFNVVKLNQDGTSVSLLDYSGFFEEAFPALRRYWTVDLAKSTVRFRTYAESLNPPILHRKELLLPNSHPLREAFSNLTRAAEQIGLFDDPRRIGFKRAWEALLDVRGYRVIGHELVPVGNDETGESSHEESFSGVARHLTALSRTNLSAPVQTLARFGFLDGSKTVFDYGCGRGGDVRGLAENGITVNGWDPYFAPDGIKQSAHIVNLGFVINVIEDPVERLEALQCAYALAEELLVVSAMLANPEAIRGIPYGDGVLTSRNTFQKYYTQGELRHWLVEALDVEPLAVAPGIFYVFKDQDFEQRFLLGRQENRRNVLKFTRQSRPEKPLRIVKADAKYQACSVALEVLWETRISLGRMPVRGEVANTETLIQNFGSIPAALRFIQSRKENADAILEQARLSRLDDLRIYFADFQFRQHSAYRHLEAGLQRDIKVFYGDYRVALEQGRALLFAAGRPETIAEACRIAAEQGLGWLEDSESLQLHTSLIAQLPPVLRVYINCGLKLYGDPESADLIKIHIRSGKLTLMRFDDFLGHPLPRLLQRVKLKLREQDFDVFDYGSPTINPLNLGDNAVELSSITPSPNGGGLEWGQVKSEASPHFDRPPPSLPPLGGGTHLTALPLGEGSAREEKAIYTPPYLYRKSRYLNEEMTNYAEQLDFDEALEDLKLFDLEGYGPKPGEFDQQLENARWSIDGFKLMRSQTIPDPDSLCGQHFTYRQLIECGDTQAKTGLPNLPKQANSYTALYELAANILDPVIDYYGPIKLTYSFSSPELAKHIKGRIAPKLDQHAACELNRKGEPVCPRLGAAVDFIVEDEDMEEVARWIIANLPYDRLYFYGKDRPIHVSYSEKPAREAWEMREVEVGGRRVPRVFR
jgi:DNA phosphorothioation-associated putative methyltransferase